MSKTFCPLPWNSINMRNSGDLRICCNANSYTKNRGILAKPDGTVFNAGKDDWDEARNADLLKDVRKTMLEGEWHSECERCRQEEINGIRSRRQFETIRWMDYTSHETAKSITSQDGTIDTQKQSIDYVDIRYGNFCNLKCRMCGPTDSHQWYSDFVESTNRSKFQDGSNSVILIKNEKDRWETDFYNWFQDNPVYWNNFEKYVVHAKSLYIVGGEPLIIPEHMASLERLIELGHAKHMTIEYNTNLTTVPDKLLLLWAQFKTVEIGASIDGYDAVFNYQRSPANFDQVYKNMLKIDADTKINLQAWLAFTVTPLNIFHLPEFMKWKLTQSQLQRFNPEQNNKCIISYHMCHSPKQYNIKVLPPELKQQVDDRFKEYIKWSKQQDFSQKIKDEFEKILTSVLRFMHSEDYSGEWLDLFVQQTKKLDQLRGQDIVEIVPEYRSLFK